jgi:hypothetical protein
MSVEAFLKIDARLSVDEPSLFVKVQNRSLGLDIASSNSHFIFAVLPGKKTYFVPSGGEVIPPIDNTKNIVKKYLKVENNEINY